MAIGIALVLIFVLYLIDKHNRWWQAFKLTVGLFVLGIVGVAGLFGWQKYQAYRDEKQEQAEAAAQQVRVSVCVSRLEQIPPPKDAVGVDVPSDIQRAFEDNPYATTYLYTSTSQALPNLPSGATLVKPKLRYVRALSGTDLTTTEFGFLKCGAVNRGDLVTLLEEGTTEIEVKTASGQTGWAAQYNIEVIR